MNAAGALRYSRCSTANQSLQRVQQEIINKAYELKHFIEQSASTAPKIATATGINQTASPSGVLTKRAVHRKTPTANVNTTTVVAGIQSSPFCDGQVSPSWVTTHDILEIRTGRNVVDNRYAPNSSKKGRSDSSGTSNGSPAIRIAINNKLLACFPQIVKPCEMPSCVSADPVMSNKDPRGQQALFLANLGLCTIDRHRELVAMTLSRGKQRRRRKTAKPLFSAKALVARNEFKKRSRKGERLRKGNQASRQADETNLRQEPMQDSQHL
ncbi:uncharacterized protein LOC111258741 isoform X1 [Varroa jacobsoni]|uniref:uncharacterized protein LOC111258741 isoform X1 n=1 Tax=Varroa jacobsoni TaxID=62625 RepID=UPI000BF5914C|nr:uncharacterized protein LOC111258741 isoform X1 [Varroa jacobsoni]